MDVRNSVSVNLPREQELFETLLWEVKQIEDGLEISQSDDDNESLEYRRKCGVSGPKRFVARCPESTKVWRGRMKGLIQEFLESKFREVEVCSREAPFLVSKYRDFVKFKAHGTWHELYHDGYRVSTVTLCQSNKRVNLTKKESVIFQDGVVGRIYNGASLERINYYSSSKKDMDFWSDWKNACRLWVVYPYLIYPILNDVVIDLLKYDIDSKPPRVLEICGGDGELAIDIAKKYKEPLDYYLLDSNKPSCKKARKYFKYALGKQKIQGEFRVIQTDITDREDYFLDKQKKEAIPDRHIDVIVGCGALTDQVLEGKEKALTVAFKCFELLKPGGKMVLAGMTHSLLTKEDFESVGFRVLNMTIPGSMYHHVSTDVDRQTSEVGWNGQLYILEHPKDDG